MIKIINGVQIEVIDMFEERQSTREVKKSLI